MRDTTRIPTILQRLQRVWEKNPDLRLGQLIANYVQEPTIYYVEDDKLIEILEKHYSKE